MASRGVFFGGGRVYQRVFVFLVMALAASPLIPVGQQLRPGKQWTLPRTPWGDPDLQGTYTTNDELGIPFERPERFAERAGSALSAEELTDFIRERQRASRPTGPFAPPTPAHWNEGNETGNSRAWLIVNPANGKIPAWTAGQSSGVTSRLRLLNHRVARRSRFVARCSGCSRSSRTAAGKSSAGWGPPNELQRTWS